MLNNVTVFDFETSGLDPVNDRVIEMAAVRIVDDYLSKYKAPAWAPKHAKLFGTSNRYEPS